MKTFLQDLIIQEQDEVFTAVFDSLKNADWFYSNSNNILVIRIQSIIDRLGGLSTTYTSNNTLNSFAMLGPQLVQNHFKLRLTLQEVVDCIGDAIGGAVFGGIVGTAQGIYNMIGGGGFSVSAIAKIARNAFRGLAWGAAIGFGWCIISETFDFSLWDWFS